ncbi:PREDICTED: MAM and LDL-receptor class A domain-containing protein 1-like [Branchiostoma belcheri]|uniref:MAM and LDL-receptor class A domain-containing protein 1-like n=1 Tax=Branchiostoma belcheri TaxID=7741 RepID=A0A6P4ZS12_BRABE|nr:PREDICTED: MAM and LDL-receptor class A domain-containing protein 1-like [Branchiostoma belcheri]
MDSFATRCIFVVLTLQHLPAGEGTTLACDFEASDMCGYTQDTTDDQDWTRHTGHTPTANTGPSLDHTMGTGHYMYLETSVGNPGDAARIVSPSFPANSAPYCLRFYYHMFGDSTGTLNLYTRKQGIMGAAVWTVIGDQGNVWKLGNAQLDGSGGFNVVFEAVRGDGFRGDIAIDDVTISQDCTPIPTTVLPTTTPYPLASPNCTFEVLSICGYRQDIHDSAQWTRHQGQTDSDSTGPGVDHTLGTVQGHYMYFEASSIDPGVTSRLLSPTLPIIPSSSTPTSYCLTFWYHMYGPHIGILNVNRKDSGGSETPLWSLSDDQGNTWQQGQLPLDGNTEPTVVFEAVRGSSYRGDIAIDDVDVIPYSGQCEFIPAFAKVPSASTPAITTRSPSTSAHISTPAALSVVTTAKQPTTETPSTTGRIPHATTVVQPTATTTHNAQLPSTNGFLSTLGKLPIETTTERKATAMSTETSSTTHRIPSVTTLPPTTVIIHPAQSNDGPTINKEAGSFQQFECDVTFPSTYLLNWMRGDEIVIRYLSANDVITWTSANFNGRVSIAGPQKSLGITSLRITDAGDFYCSVHDLASVNAERNSARQTLFVYTRPSVSLPYSDVIVEAGGDTTFTCTVTSYPSSNVTWEHPDGTRSSGDILRLHSVTSQSEGQYRCLADNGFGTDMQYVNLVVQEATRGVTVISGGFTSGVMVISGANPPAGQLTGNNSASTTALGVSLPLCLVVGAAAGAAAMIYHRKK